MPKEQLEKLVQEHLAKGGRITTVPKSRRNVRPSHWKYLVRAEPVGHVVVN